MEFAVNNKVHSATKVSSFIVNYGRELRMGTDIRKKEKVEKVIEFVKRDEKDPGRSRSSTKECIRRDEETSR